MTTLPSLPSHWIISLNKTPIVFARYFFYSGCYGKKTGNARFLHSFGILCNAMTCVVLFTALGGFFSLFNTFITILSQSQVQQF